VQQGFSHGLILIEKQEKFKKKVALSQYARA